MIYYKIRESAGRRYETMKDASTAAIHFAKLTRTPRTVIQVTEKEVAVYTGGV